MYAKIKKNNRGGVMLHCPNCDNALGINPIVIRKCDKCNTEINHTKEYVNDWLLYCNHVMNMRNNN